MKKSLILVLIALSAALYASAQKPRPRSTPASVPAKPSVDKGKVSGRTYTNNTFKFEVTFPDTWLIPDDDFEAYMKKQGFDLSLKAPDSLAPATRTQVNKALQKVTIL